MKTNTNYFDWTERPGALLPQDSHQIIQHRYRRASRLAKGKTVLEVGCGSACGLTYIKQSADWAVGIEYCSKNIELIKSAYSDQLSVVNGDGQNLPFADKSFDVVFALAMIYYMDLDRFLQSAKRVLKPGAMLFFCTSNKDVPGFVPALFTTRYYSVPELRTKLEKNGFTCTFYGAFPSSASPLIVRKTRAFIKTMVKAVIRAIPGGARIWEKARLSGMGPLLPLPTDMETENLDAIEEIRLSPDKKNTCYRVIYVEAVRQQ